MARPSKYSIELTDKICDILSTSNRGLHSICEELNIAPSSVYKWLAENKEFSDKYTRAREDQADFLADEMLKIADDAEGDNAPFVGVNRIHRAKLQIETRKWIASKLKPKKYGEKLDVTSDGEKITSYNIGFKKPDEEENG
jgi:hypothetical protein